MKGNRDIKFFKLPKGNIELRTLMPKEKHFHIGMINVDSKMSTLICDGDDCPVCRFLKENLTLKDRLITFFEEVWKAFRKLVRK